jgi:hypothetical protein
MAGNMNTMIIKIIYAQAMKEIGPLYDFHISKYYHCIEELSLTKTPRVKGPGLKSCPPSHRAIIGVVKQIY